MEDIPDNSKILNHVILNLKSTKRLWREIKKSALHYAEQTHQNKTKNQLFIFRKQLSRGLTVAFSL